MKKTTTGGVKMLYTQRIKKSASLAISTLLAFVFVLVMALTTYAAPANPHPFSFIQDCGTEITLFFRGDEFFAWWEDENGNVVAYDAQSGNWRYADVAGDAIRPVGHVVGRAGDGFAPINRAQILHLIEGGWRFDPGDPSLEFLNGRTHINHGSMLSRANFAVPSLLAPAQAAPSIASTGSPITAEIIDFGGGSAMQDIQSIGNNSSSTSQQLILLPISPAVPLASTTAALNAIRTNQRLLVLMIEFNNMPLLNDSAFYHNKYFNTSPDAISVANYFRDMAGGRDIFVPAGNVTTGGTFRTQLNNSNLVWATRGVDVTITASTHSGVVHVKLDMDHPVTAWSAPAGHEATRAVVSLALAAIHNNNPNFNFSNIYVAAVIAGGEAADNYNPGGQIWGHAWQYQGAVVGQTGWMRYMAYGERQRGGNTMGIGIPVHELGHVLGLPDLYDLSGQSEGVGPYSVMGFGSWGRAPGDAAVGHRPTAMDAWSRMQLGFVRPTVVSQGWRGNISSLSAANNVIKVTNSVGGDQFFLVENRGANNRWDAGLNQWIRNRPDAVGILIFHIDESMRRTNPSDMSGNNNNRNRLMVGVREADGSALLSNAVVRWNNKDDHFFTSGNFSIFGAQTNPASHFHSATGRNVVTGIEVIVHSERGEEMEVEVVFN